MGRESSGAVVAVERVYVVVIEVIPMPAIVRTPTMPDTNRTLIPR
jgi:hypothetical protein